MKSSGRPEDQLPAHMYYNKNQAKKYSECSRIINIQKEMTERAIELLNMPKGFPFLVLDIGCGSGISGEVLSNNGLFWVGVDISSEMLNIQKDKKSMSLGDALLNDMGQTLPFRVGSFDYCVSISALQWLCTKYNRKENPVRRIKEFFTSLYRVLRRGGKAVLQFYPENEDSVNMFMKGAASCGFHGGVVVDFPNSSKAKKFYLVLFAGVQTEPLPQALSVEEEKQNKQKTSRTSSDLSSTNPSSIPNINTEQEQQEHVQMYARERRHRINSSKKKKYRKKERMSLKEYVVRKKVRDRLRGRKTASDSKYTGRKRRTKF